MLAIALALSALGATVLAQAPFPAELERLIWKSLGAWVPLEHNTPSSAAVQQFFVDGNGGVQPVKDLFGNDVYASPFPNDYQAEFAALLTGECSYSAFGDWDVYGLDWVDKDSGYGPFTRQCKAANGSPVPPPTGSLLNPVGVAIDGERVYVADNFNHRVQVFDFFGRPIELSTPIGNGIPGMGGPSGPGEPAGEKLSAPEGILVDAAHRIAVADGWNQRIAVFNPDGALAFDHVLAPGIDGDMKPSTIALTPGATLMPPGSSGAAVDHRLVVTDWTHCQVQIVDTAFNVIKSLPEAVNTPPESQASHDACWDPEQHVTLPGQFSTVTGVTVDSASRIYLSDHAQNVVQVFDKDGNFLASIGRPGEQPAPGELLGPVGLMIDHLGRLGIIDGEHARVAFYSLDFSIAPVATFQFQLDVTVAVQDFPMGLAEQWCNPAVPGACPADNPDTPLNEATLNDSKGRYIATDPLRRQLLRFELPDLAIINGTAVAGAGTFDVVVPKQKASPVIGVHVDVQPVEALTTVDAPPTPPTPQDIGAGQLVSYSFPYTQTGPTATFRINASGDFDAASGTDLAVADEATVTARAACDGCAAAHAVFNDPPPAVGSPEPATLLTAPNGTWYGREVFVRMTAAAPGVPTPGNTVAAIGWYISGAAAATYGSGINQTTVAGGPLDVIVRVNGRSSLTYWPIAQDGSVGAQVAVPLWLDLVEPEVNFLSSLWTAPIGTDQAGRLWNNTAVTGGYVVIDTDSGSPADTVAGAAVPDGSVAFTAEGRDQFAQLTVADYVGHATTVSTATSTGGRLVSIDRGAPVVTPPADLTVVQDGSNFAPVPASFIASATDPLLGNGQNGSGVASVVGSCTGLMPVGIHTCEFTARDHAGNVAAAAATLTVLGKRPSVITYTGPASVVYGEALNLSAIVTPVSATGVVTFTFDGLAPVSGVLAGGAAASALAAVTNNVGSHTLTLQYAGDTQVEAATASVQITVTPRPIHVRATDRTKTFTDPDPPLTYSIISGTLVGGDAFSGALARDAGEALGDYPIRQGTLALSPNYLLLFTPGKLTIGEYVVTVTALPATKVYGEPDPVFTFAQDRSLPPGYAFSGSLTREFFGQPGGESTGNFQILRGTLSLPAGFAIIYKSDIFSIVRRDATVIAGDAAKVFGSVDPLIGVSAVGLLASDNIVISVSRTPGEHAGSYPTLPHAEGDALRHYNLGLQAGLFTITQARVAVIPAPQDIVYGEATPAFTFSYGPFPGTYTEANVVTPPTCGVAGPHTSAGTYPIACSNGVIDNNAVFVYEQASFVVRKRAVTLVIDDASRPFGAANPSFTATPAGLVGGDALSFTLTTAAQALSNVGQYPITAAVVENLNYVVSAPDGILTVTRAPAAVVATAQSKVYGQANPPLDAMVTGEVPGAPLSFAVSTTATAASGVGSYPITVAAGPNPNYALTIIDSTLTITALPVTVRAGNAEKYLNQPDPPLAPLVTHTGFLPADGVVLSATREPAGEAPGTYAIVPVALAPPAVLANYAITYVNGVFVVHPNAPPMCTAATGGEIWPPNHKRFIAAPITNVVDPEGLPLTIVITAILQDEVIDSTGDGRFSPDASGVGTATAWLRAERNGHGNKMKGNGRVYEIMFTATDAGGAQCQGSVLYTVPHDQGQHPAAIDDGVRYDSTAATPGTRDKTQVHQKRAR